MVRVFALVLSTMVMTVSGRRSKKLYETTAMIQGGHRAKQVGDAPDEHAMASDVNRNVVRGLYYNGARATAQTRYAGSHEQAASMVRGTVETSEVKSQLASDVKRNVVRGLYNNGARALAQTNRYAGSHEQAVEGVRGTVETSVVKAVRTATEITPPGGDSEFEVTIDHSDGSTYGMKYSNRTSGGLEITAVRPGGLMQQWNDEEFNEAIRAGDVIVSVNGQKGYHHIDQETNKLKLMRMTIRRPKAWDKSSNVQKTSLVDREDKKAWHSNKQQRVVSRGERASKLSQNRTETVQKTAGNAEDDTIAQPPLVKQDAVHVKTVSHNDQTALAKYLKFPRAGSGAGYLVKELENATAETCAAQCDQMLTCEGFTFEGSTGGCKLKSAVFKVGNWFKDTYVKRGSNSFFASHA